MTQVVEILLHGRQGPSILCDEYRLQQHKNPMYLPIYGCNKYYGRMPTDNTM